MAPPLNKATFVLSPIGGSGCEAVRAVVGVSARVILDTSTLKKLNNDVETLANFLPVGGVLEFDLAELVLDDSVKFGSPTTIEGNGATVQCPEDQRKGAFKIRCLDSCAKLEGSENVGGGLPGLDSGCGM
ncbi:hypothetical protein BSKO_06921 [Bryopsis sp. KO-2023]|nr:hypothetical protein BSKO_06921 [Bryopsis sp. KO-2023]